MTGPTRAGGIDIKLTLAAGRIAHVGITSERALGLGRLAAGRSPDSAVALVSRLFSLCSMAQGAAAEMAIAAARGIAIDATTMRARIAAVLVERLFELLRGTVTALAGAEIAPFASALRRIAGAVRVIDRVTRMDIAATDSALTEIETALADLDLRPDSFSDHGTFAAWLAQASPLTALMRAIAEDDIAASPVIDPLDSDADRHIGELLFATGVEFVVQPDIAGRVPETGAMARNAHHPLMLALTPRYGAGAFARLVARLVEAAETPARLRAIASGQDDPPIADIACFYRLADGLGLAAIECARGRLYHLAAVDRSGKVARLEILAPTEWNFHPQGPLVRALSGAASSGDQGARARAERLVAAFDPCVAHHVRFAGAGHA